MLVNLSMKTLRKDARCNAHCPGPLTNIALAHQKRSQSLAKLHAFRVHGEILKALAIVLP